MRTSLWLSQGDAAKLAGVTRTALVKVETGARSPSIVSFTRIVTAYWIYTRQVYPKQIPEFLVWLEDLMNEMADSYVASGIRKAQIVRDA